MVNIASASVVYIEANKETNGRSVWKVPAVEAVFENGNIFFEPEIALKFTAERGSTVLDHHSLNANFNLGITGLWFENSFVSFSQGIEYFLDGNADNIPVGIEFYNCLRIGAEF